MRRATMLTSRSPLRWRRDTSPSTWTHWSGPTPGPAGGTTRQASGGARGGPGVGHGGGQDERGQRTGIGDTVGDRIPEQRELAGAEGIALHEHAGHPNLSPDARIANLPEIGKKGADVLQWLVGLSSRGA